MLLFLIELVSIRSLLLLLLSLLLLLLSLLLLLLVSSLLLLKVPIRSYTYITQNPAQFSLETLLLLLMIIIFKSV